MMTRLKSTKLLLGIGAVTLLLLLAFPIGMVIAMSVAENPSTSFLSGVSLKWYLKLFAEKEWLEALLSSLELSLLTTLISGFLGLLSAIALYDVNRKPMRGNIGFSLVTMPMFAPSIVLGIGLSWITEVLGLPGMLSIALSLSIVTTPLFLICVLVAMQGVDSQLKYAAASLGANRLTTFILVTLPLIKKGVVIGSFISFLSAFDELVISLFVIPPEIQTLPIKFWSSLRFYASPLIAPVSTVMWLAMVIVLTFTFIYGRKNGVNSKRH